MKKIILAVAFAIVCSFGAFAGEGMSKDSIAPDPKDVGSMDGILTALYDVISGPAGQKRNWDRFRTLFIPEARMIPIGKRADGNTGKKVMSIEDYINSSSPILEKMGFFETELHRKVETFGGVVHVFSTYESRKMKEDPAPFMRGINSIQLWNDGKRWWVVTIYWQNETPQLPIPEKYLKD
ncbi:hypothetical protein HHL16_04030 [Pseudoflavitalea sp. G-6-1-2]|uniref:hypothetical protein n=1 Tax=Pseudoflavitalea sp. G-6-1-2 TaxID=2728841 RepID=UPI00146AAF46|nr:hypothetical protein [Pseudoflavitalea sp. G-6-1-2]NML20026.1 hypothetical protein [Pseudoflavitalea sp. G-6-1-2]